MVIRLRVRVKCKMNGIDGVGVAAMKAVLHRPVDLLRKFRKIVSWMYLVGD